MPCAFEKSWIISFPRVIRDDLGKFSGRVFYTGRQLHFADVPIGKNLIAKVPHEMAEFLKKETVANFTFHSFRRSSATAAADSGATAQQMVDFFGWNNHSMPQEYISTSKGAVNMMAQNLAPTVSEANKSSEEETATERSFDKNVAFSSNNTDLFSICDRNRVVQNNEKVIFINNFNGSINL